MLIVNSSKNYVNPSWVLCNIISHKTNKIKTNIFNMEGRMKKNIKHLSFRVDKELLRKFEYVAKYDDRSMNWMLLSFVRKCIADFETEHGEIEISKTEKD